MKSKPTLGIHVGDIFQLDACVWRAQAEGRIHIDDPKRPVRDFANDVLLVADGRKASDSANKGRVFFVVGVLTNATLAKDGYLEFEKLTRFTMPIPVSSQIDDGLVVEILEKTIAWSPQGFYYLAPNAVEHATQIAEHMARPVVTELRGRAPHEESASPQVGCHRVYLTGVGGQHALTAYIPLGSDARLDLAAPRPWLVKGKFEAYDWFGEFIPEKSGWHRLVWGSSSEEDSVTDLGSAPIQVGTRIKVHDGGSLETKPWLFTVRNVQRV